MLNAFCLPQAFFFAADSLPAVVDGREIVFGPRDRVSEFAQPPCWPSPKSLSSSTLLIQCFWSCEGKEHWTCWGKLNFLLLFYFGTTQDKLARVSGANIELHGQDLVLQGDHESIEIAQKNVNNSFGPTAWYQRTSRKFWNKTSVELKVINVVEEKHKN